MSTGTVLLVSVVLLQVTAAVWLLQGCLGKEGQRMRFGREAADGHGAVMCGELPETMHSGLLVHMFASRNRQQC